MFTYYLQKLGQNSPEMYWCNAREIIYSIKQTIIPRHYCL